MNQDTFAKLVTALSEYQPSSSSIYSPPNQAFDTSLHSYDYANKTLGHNVKTENLGNTDCSYPANTSCLNAYPSSVTMMGDSEQVPMDDYDPLESFAFWDGETFYSTPDLDANLDANCGLLTNLSAESEMAELQDYLIRDDILTHDDFPHLGNSDPTHNPTLAELNSCSDALFDCSVENSFLSEDSGYLLSPDMLSKSVPGNECFIPTTTMVSGVGPYISNIGVQVGNFNDTKNQSVLSSSCPVTSQAINCAQYFGACDERLLLCPQNSPASDSFMPKSDTVTMDSQLTLPGSSKLSFGSKRLRPHPKLSTSAPLDVCSSIENSPCIKSESPSSCSSKNAEKSLSSFSALSLSNDDESGSYFDSDHDDDDDDDDGFSSDDDMYQYDSDDAHSTSWPPAKEAKGQPRRNRFFWQYNLQSRGLKTHNLLPLSEEVDPYVLNDVKDPVFSEECTLPVKHSGKARKGDGNDLTPNPRKLYSIGMELKKLNKMIYNLNPQEFTSHGKPLSRKEKNKLASRVCRLKKKAQHEANKIKLYGLQQEHKRLLRILFDVKQLIVYKIEHFQDAKNIPCFQKLENYLALHEPVKIAGNTTEFVNEVLSKVSKGDGDGGLGKL